MELNILKRIITFVSVFVITVTGTQDIVETVPVLIVGAGIAGVTCGRYLADHGMNDFIIVEADDRVGGRMRPFEFQGYTLELGANWIEGTVGNPLWKFKEKLDLKGSVTNFSDFVVYYEEERSGRLVKSFGPDLPEYHQFQDAVQAANNLSLELQKEHAEDMTLRAALEIGGWHPRTPLEKALEWSVVDFEAGDIPEVTSLTNQWPMDSFIKYKDEQFMILDQRGYVTVVHDIMHNAHFINESESTIPAVDLTSNIILNTRVVSIHWNLTNDLGEEVIRVTMNTGVVYEAKFVVLTVSLGVLQYQEIEFVPRLPDWKIESIYVDEMAIYTKIFMQFDHCFWEDNEFFIYASKQRGYYSYWQNMNHPKYFPGSNILMVTATTPQSMIIENQDSTRTISEAMEVLETIFWKNISRNFKASKKSIHPKAVEIPLWLSDPLTRGSFSNWPAGMTSHQKDDLAKTVNGNLLFSGEATNDMSGYVHGGYFSGIESAKEILTKVSRI
jgi:polyamine oxidase